MDTGAGALGLALCGVAIYSGDHGDNTERLKPQLGIGRAPDAKDIARTVCLLRRSLWLFWGASVIALVAAYAWFVFASGALSSGVVS